MNQPLPWRTSTYSEKVDCVEVANVGSGALVRDTKHRAGGMVSASAPAWSGFLAAVKGGRLDR